MSQVSPPVSPPSPPIPFDVDLGVTAQRVARGSAVIVPVTVTCAPGAEFPAVQVVLTQRRLRGVARGFGFTEGINCTGFPTRVDVTVTANNRAFGRGGAFAQAMFSASYGGTFVSDSDAGTISVRR